MSKLVERKSEPRLETPYVTGPDVCSPDVVLTLKHTRANFIREQVPVSYWQADISHTHHSEERVVRWVSCPRFHVHKTVLLSLVLTL